MTAKNARIVANVIVFAAGGALAFLALRRPFIRRAALRAVPMVLGGTPPWQVAAFLAARAIAHREPEPAVPRRQAACAQGSGEPATSASARVPV